VPEQGKVVRPGDIVAPATAPPTIPWAVLISPVAVVAAESIAPTAAKTGELVTSGF